MNQNEKTNAESRRQFLKKSALATAAVATSANLFKTPVYGQNQAPSPGRVIGANDRINVGVVGVGPGIGMNHFKGIHGKAGDNNTQLIAVCDLYNKRRDEAKDFAKITADQTYSDHRKMMENKDIDAVLVATHDVWHAPITIDALEAGKHVYSEKPMTRYLDEAFQVYDTVKKTGKIFQVGSQGCSAAGWHKAAELVKAGKIGQLVWGQGFYCRNSIGGEWNYDLEAEMTPENINWERWMGSIKNKIPFSAEHFRRWRKYYPYCGGLLGDLVPHRLHPLVVASGNPEFPTRVTSIGTHAIHADKNKPAPEREVAEHVQLMAEFPSGYLITVTCSSVNAKSPGFVIYGHKATLSIGSSGEKVELVPEKEFSEEIDAASFTGLTPTEDARVHEKNWFDCIRSGKAPNANIDLAIRVQTVICLAEMSNRMNIMCLFDEKTRKITTGDGKEVPAITYGTLAQS